MHSKPALGYFNDIMNSESSAFITAKGRESDYLTASQLAKRQRDHEKFKSLFLQATTKRISGKRRLKPSKE